MFGVVMVRTLIARARLLAGCWLLRASTHDDDTVLRLSRSQARISLVNLNLVQLPKAAWCAPQIQLLP
jgi:hypothetical protein